MKNLLIIRFIILITIVIAACNSAGKKSMKNTDSGPVSRVEVSISGMDCAACEQTIQTKVAKLDGIKSVKASFDKGKAFIDYTSSVSDIAKIRKAITEAGFMVTNFAFMLPGDSVR